MFLSICLLVFFVVCIQKTFLTDFDSASIPFQFESAIIQLFSFRDKHYFLSHFHPQISISSRTLSQQWNLIRLASSNYHKIIETLCDHFTVNKILDNPRWNVPTFFMIVFFCACSRRWWKRQITHIFVSIIKRYQFIKNNTIYDSFELGVRQEASTDKRRKEDEKQFRGKKIGSQSALFSCCALMHFFQESLFAQLMPRTSASTETIQSDTLLLISKNWKIIVDLVSLVRNVKKKI